MKKITYISGSRADYGNMSPLLLALDKDKDFSLNLYATGMHLMPEFGDTLDDVKKDFPYVTIIPVKFNSNNRVGMANFVADLLKETTNLLIKKRPDLVILYGDRFEMLATAVASLYLGIPIAHIHGGDKTFSVDDSARHAISKIAHIHFPANDEAATRLKQMGEEDWRIHMVGSLTLDSILNSQLIPRDQLLKKIDLPSDKKFILVTQHPVSEEINEAKKQIQNAINAVKVFDLPVVVIYPNADAGSNQIIEVIEGEKNNPMFRIFKNLDHLTFLSLEKEASVWVGNSSAGVVESGSFKTPVVNVGTRQTGRKVGENVISVGYNKEEIHQAIKKSIEDSKYLESIKNSINPWGDGKSTPRIMKVLKQLDLSKKLLIKK